LGLALVVVLILSFCFHVGPWAHCGVHHCLFAFIQGLVLLQRSLLFLPFMLGHVLTMELIWSSYFCVGPCTLMICIQPTKCTSN
jgi:hypothetical protein